MSSQVNTMIDEFHSNSRLQWMVLAVLIILCISSISWLSSLLEDKRIDTQRLVNLLARLEQTAAQPFDEALLGESAQQLEQALDAIPTAGSASTAEAQALKQLELLLGDIITRKRLNLLGSDELKAHEHLFWQVRIEINGQLKNKDLIALLTNFDANQAQRRINSFRYRPSASNSLSLVADFIYVQDNNE